MRRETKIAGRVQYELTTHSETRCTLTIGDGEPQEYVARGGYVYRVWPTGVRTQVCRGLRAEGPTIHHRAGEYLADIILGEYISVRDGRRRESR